MLVPRLPLRRPRIGLPYPLDLFEEGRGRVAGRRPGAPAGPIRTTPPPAGDAGRWRARAGRSLYHAVAIGFLVAAAWFARGIPADGVREIVDLLFAPAR